MGVKNGRRIQPEVVAVRTGVGIDSRKKIPYFVGVSEATTGARGLSLQYVIIPPGAAAVPHIHQGYETAIYVLSGRVETTYGAGLHKSVVSGPGEFCTSRRMFHIKRET